MTARKIWIDGALVDWDKAQVHLLSHSLQRGSLVFDYMKVNPTPKGPAVFRLKEHLERFLQSAELIGLPVPLGREALEAAVLAALRANVGAKNVKICAYIPSIEVEVVPMDARVAVAVAAYDPEIDIVQKSVGKPHRAPTLRVRIARERDKPRPKSMPPHAKAAASYLSPMTAKWRARKEGFDEVLLLDENENLAEGPTSNVFLVDREGNVLTPSLQYVLSGITRRSIIEIARDAGRQVFETEIAPARIFEMAEVFLTTTTQGVWPVVEVDGQKIGDGTPGPVSQDLLKRYQDAVYGRDLCFEHWLTYVDAPK